MMLTTITVYWNRPEALRIWLRCLKAAAVPEVRHLIYFVGESIPSWWDKDSDGVFIRALHQFELPGMSIGHYHNLGAQETNTEWIMKLDVDALPHANYFKALLPLLVLAKDREWFNGGMFYLKRYYTLLNSFPTDVYEHIMRNRRSYSGSSYLLPAASNFICRRMDYLNLGGCDERFRGYGWEDYQQIYMLERSWLGRDPLPGELNLGNVTARCRDEISRPKARELWEKNSQLCLLHRWHPVSTDPSYRASMDANRQVLLDWIKYDRSQ